MESKCDNHNMVYVKRIKSNGSPLVNKQCFECGEHDAKAYKLIEVGNFNIIPTFREDLKDKFYFNQRDIMIKNMEDKKTLWFKKYYEPYLNSDEWKSKRDLVLKRDSFLCQSCLTSKATQVHHTTYKHVFNEPLFELVSICKPCHDLITKLDRDKNGN